MSQQPNNDPIFDKRFAFCIKDSPSLFKFKSLLVRNERERSIRTSPPVYIETNKIQWLDKQNIPFMKSRL